MRRRAAALAVAALLLVALTASASARPRAQFASSEIETVVAAGLMGPSVDDFRPNDALTASELAVVVASLGGAIALDHPDALVTVRELDARLVTLVGLRSSAQAIRLAAVDAGLSARPWLGTETVARVLGFRVNHPREEDELELEVNAPITRAEAAYSIAGYLGLSAAEIESTRTLVDSFSLPSLSAWQRIVLDRALRLVGTPYVWAGMSEKTQVVLGRQLPGGFDCSGFVWRVYKTKPFTGAPELTRVLVGRTTYAMSGEVGRANRVSRDALAPGDVVFFGSNGTRSKPSQVGHMGIYVGNGWIVHSSRYGTTLTPMTGWYETTFAWGRSPLVEAGLEY
jgi:cell wall-associated NlpC family hydrolase